MMDIKSPDVVFLGSTFEESVPASSTDAPARPGARAGDVRTPDPELGVHEKGSFHGQTPDSDLGVHEKGSFHGQTPDPDLVVHEKGPFHGRTPDPELGVHEKGSFHGVNFPFLRQALKRSVCSAISSSRTPSSK